MIHNRFQYTSSLMVMRAMQQMILLHLAAMSSLRPCQVPVASHHDLLQHPPILSGVHPGAVYGEVNLPKCCALFPCQLVDNSVPISIVGKMKYPKPIVNIKSLSLIK